MFECFVVFYTNPQEPRSNFEVGRGAHISKGGGGEGTSGDFFLTNSIMGGAQSLSLNVKTVVDRSFKIERIENV